jgi:molybdate transport system permease protein
MLLSDSDLQAIWLTVRLAGIVTLILLLVGTPIAWWLARSKAWWKGPVGAVVALPLVLPPSVLGFYLLLAMGPNGLVGQLTQSLGLGLLPFTFWGLVIASVFYSLPFMVQPLQTRLSRSASGRWRWRPPCAPRRWMRFLPWPCRWRCPVL